MKKNLEAWQKAPVKIVSEAIQHAKKKNEEDNLIAFLLLDAGAEMLLKTYLGLPKKITGATTSEDDRYNIIRRGFHDVVEGVKNSRQGINTKDLARVEFFHGIRNKLYHQGNGLTVQRVHLEEYSTVIKSLFKQLLKIDLDIQLESSRLTKEEAKLITLLNAEINKSLEFTKSKIKELEFSCNLVVEMVAPKLLLPSFTKKFEDLIEKAFSEDGYTLEGNDVITYKILPYRTDERMKIVEWFEGLIKPLVESSPYFDALFCQVEAGSRHHIEALGCQLGIKNIELERYKVPHIVNFIFNNHFDLNDLYINIVGIVLFDEFYFKNDLDFTIVDIKNIYPQSNEESDVEYWESVLNTVRSESERLDTYISRINLWLESESKK
ncbi:hypothetical protein [Enterovibrio norvegicus]|uniref:Uncharacterized protein n=1 Tax=Enterovibrio norvegicus DSM 15893 TaxID=1121869 RepID=A0A1I5NL43_9GAMM|nr:hypothetical protein [Enterovibrio norvegicus]SFP22533.1 hypothetical protein SAMN03084138_01637 [Enterovibrio norvegicus DSM 15893]